MSSKALRRLHGFEESWPLGYAGFVSLQFEMQLLLVAYQLSWILEFEKYGSDNIVRQVSDCLDIWRKVSITLKWASNVGELTSDIAYAGPTSQVQECRGRHGADTRRTAD
jgi:hypothetical protein